MFFIVHINSSLISGRFFLHDYIVLSSAKFQISDFSTKTKISLMNILNNSGLNVELCGIPWQILDHLLYDEPTLFLCFLKPR